MAVEAVRIEIGKTDGIWIVDLSGEPVEGCPPPEQSPQVHPPEEKSGGLGI